jgi:hypothetical protein
MTAISRQLDRDQPVDRRVLKRLHEDGVLPGVRWGGVIWLERRPLAAYLWSRPRCIVDGCNRRVIGDGPGCHRHWRSGRRRVHHSCAECGRETTGRGQLCRSCATRQGNARRGPDSLDRLREGKVAYPATIKRVKAERGLVDVGEVRERLRKAGVPRSAGAISGYIEDELVSFSPAKRPDGRPFRKPLLFEAATVDLLIAELRDHGDGRLTRWNATTPEQARTRATLYRARHNSEAEFGRVASAINRPGPKRQSNSDEQALVFELRGEGLSIREIAERVFGGESEASGRGKVARLLKSRAVT